jgi:hypothetical protein
LVFCFLPEIDLIIVPEVVLEQYQYLLLMSCLGIVGIIMGYVFKDSFNNLRIKILDDISNKINKMLTGFLNFNDDLLYLGADEVEI